MAGESYVHCLGQERGVMVERAGQKYIEVDFHGQKVLRPYRELDWIPAKDIRPMSRMQAAEVAHMADMVLCKFLRVTTRLTPWIGLTDEQKIRWRDEGPKHPVRAAVYKAIMGAIPHEVE